MKIENIYFVLK